MANLSPESSEEGGASKPSELEDLIERIQRGTFECSTSDSGTSTTGGNEVVTKAEALLFLPGYYVLGRSDLDINPIDLDQVKNNQWNATKSFYPIYGDTVDIVDDVFVKVQRMAASLLKEKEVQIKSIEYHGIRDSGVESKRQKAQYLFVLLEKNKYRGDPIVSFITKTVREFLVESKLPEAHCLVTEDNSWR